ncbi:gamma-aminobutyric acid receptor alpha-like [Musca autumnalis]|uniref:gamma-aminobutyric acid receptor alpha-like n=1 Tax=Musca autumnalis TaxID=221902 RepID=UPI003CF7E576
MPPTTTPSPSFAVGYTTADVIYRWNKERPAVAIAEDMKLSQFDLVDCPAGNLTDVVYKASSPYHANARNYADTSGGTTHQVHHSTHHHQQKHQHQEQHHHHNTDDNNNNDYGQFNKTLTTFAGPGVKNQHVRGTGIQLDKASSFGGGAGGGHIRLESDQSSEYSMLMVNFHLQRHMGNFLIQVYGPCCLLVVLSWVSFWLNREATADRVSLGITTVLTMTFLGLEARTDLPKVPYPTALDFFVFLSFAFIFATILQFAVVHYFTKYGSGECYFIIEELDSDTETESAVRQTHKIGMTGMSPEYEDTNSSTETKIYEVIPLAMCSINIPKGGSRRQRRQSRDSKYRRQSSWMNCWSQFLQWSGCRQKRGRHKTHFGSSDEDGEEIHLRVNEDVTPKKYSGRRRMSYYRREELDARRKGKRTPQYNSVSKIDRASRIVFPILFLLINMFYWYGYLSRSSRILAHSNSTT